MAPPIAAAGTTANGQAAALSLKCDGTQPYGTLTSDKPGNLYGTTFKGGSTNFGTVLKLAADGTETVLHTFTGGSDGPFPKAGVIIDKAGNLFRTTLGSGVGNCINGNGCGTVFEIAAEGTETVLHAFTGGKDGATP